MEEEAFRREPRLPREGRRLGRGGEAALGSAGVDQRLDRWMTRGRALVDGVSGARPGSRPAGSERAASGWTPARLGRWVEDRLDALLEDDGDDWREPWQEEPMRPRAEEPARPPFRAASPTPRAASPAPRAASPAPSSGSRRSLEAISRRTAPASAEGVAPEPPSSVTARPASARPEVAATDDWPEADAFSVPRWSRASGRPSQAAASGPASQPTPEPGPSGGGRLLPRSSRRR